MIINNINDESLLTEKPCGHAHPPLLERTSTVNCV